MWDDGKGNKRERLQDGPHSEYADHHYGFQTLYKQRSLKVTKINLLQSAGQKCNAYKATDGWKGRGTKEGGTLFL